jgi:hypothetical protein
MTDAMSPPHQGGFSPRSLARLAGFFYLLTILAGMVAQMAISGRLVVPGDAAATAAGIQTHGALFRMGYTLYLLEMASQVVMAVLFYLLLRPAGPGTARVVLVLNLMGCGIKTMSRLFYLAPVLVLGGAPFLGVFTEAQLPALALLLLGLNDLGAGIALPFFGLATILEGYLILRSTFLPRALGVLGILGGIGWSLYLVPAVGARLFPMIVGVGLLGALITIGWLLLVGVDEGRWKAQARAAASRPW